MFGDQFLKNLLVREALVPDNRILGAGLEVERETWRRL